MLVQIPIFSIPYLCSNRTSCCLRKLEQWNVCYILNDEPGKLSVYQNELMEEICVSLTMSMLPLNLITRRLDVFFITFLLTTIKCASLVYKYGSDLYTVI